MGRCSLCVLVGSCSPVVLGESRQDSVRISIGNAFSGSMADGEHHSEVLSPLAPTCQGIEPPSIFLPLPAAIRAHPVIMIILVFSTGLCCLLSS